MKTTSLSPRFRERLNGALTDKLKPRAIDTLFRLRDQCGLDGTLIDAWERLETGLSRKTEYIHGDRGFLMLCYRVTVLFFHLVFLLIGYKGKYTDYGAVNWRLKEFGLELAEPEHM